MPPFLPHPPDRRLIRLVPDAVPESGSRRLAPYRMQREWTPPQPRRDSSCGQAARPSSARRRESSSRARRTRSREHTSLTSDQTTQLGQWSETPWARWLPDGCRIRARVDPTLRAEEAAGDLALQRPNLVESSARSNATPMRQNATWCEGSESATSERLYSMERHSRCLR